MSNISEIINGNAGGAQNREGTTIQTFLLSLAAGAVLFGVQFGAFTIFRNYLWAKRIYQPRSFLVPLKDRVKPPPNNLFRWAVNVFTISSPTEVLHKAGMDAYFFLRYLTMCLRIFLPTALFIWPILFPLNVIGGKGARTIGNIEYNVKGLDILAWSNVSPENTHRYWAHLILAIIVIIWTCFVFHQELMHYVKRRQEYLGSPSHRLKASSTTVLITDIPSQLCTTEALTELYDDFPGGIRRIWINRDYSKLAAKDELRRQISDILENAETNLLRKVVKKSKKMPVQTHGETGQAARQSSVMKEQHESSTRDVSAKSGHDATGATPIECQKDLQHDIDTEAAWTTYLKPKERQTMRIPNPDHTKAFKIPLIGKFFGRKVDTIYYCRRELARLNAEMDRDVEQADSLPMSGSAFIQFNTQKAAHLACQAVAATMPRQMLQRTVEIAPADINWFALSKSWLNRLLRLIIFFLLIVVVIIVFGLISFFTGILSKLSTLADTTSWLSWVSSLPTWLLSFIQGTLPPIILVFILSGPTPIVLRSMTNGTRGAITKSQGERSLQYWYFILLFLELFIVPTISAGLTTIVQDIITNAASVTNILALNLPTAANYYFSFIVVQALSISGSSICQTVRLFNYYVIGGVNTPDAVFAKLTFTHFTRIGSNIPWYTVFAVIGLVYSVIAPLMLVFVIATFALFWLIIKNNVLYVVRTGDVDSGALWFPHAITQTFTGLYFMEICLIGLFFLVRDVNNEVACTAQGTIMAVCLALTILYQIWMLKNFQGLIKYAPLELETIAGRQDREYEMERLTPIDDAVQLSEKRPANLERAASQNPDASGSSLEKDTSVLPPNIDFGSEPRRVSTKATTTAFAERSRDLQVKKEHDKEKAKTILARLNRPLDEARLQVLETQLAAVEHRLGNVFLPRSKDIEARMLNDPISKIIMQHNDELEDLTPEERDMLISVAFTHPVLRDPKPCIWIPRDEFGVSDDEVARTKALSEHLNVDNRGAEFNKKLKLDIDKAPPDLSEFAFVMAEL